MDELKTLIEDMNLSPAQMQELSDTLRINPLAAMGLIQKFQISPDILQRLLQLFMTNPQAMMEMAQQAGISSDLVDQVQGQFPSLTMPSPPKRGD